MLARACFFVMIISFLTIYAHADNSGGEDTAANDILERIWQHPSSPHYKPRPTKSPVLNCDNHKEVTKDDLAALKAEIANFKDRVNLLRDDIEDVECQNLNPDKFKNQIETLRKKVDAFDIKIRKLNDCEYLFLKKRLKNINLNPKEKYNGIVIRDLVMMEFKKISDQISQYGDMEIIYNTEVISVKDEIMTLGYDLMTKKSKCDTGM